MATVIRSETHPEVASYGDVNRDVLKLLSRPGKPYFIILAAVLAVLGLGVFAWMVQVILGIGMSGLMNPVARRVWKACKIDGRPSRYRGQPSSAAA